MTDLFIKKRRYFDTDKFNIHRDDISFCYSFFGVDLYTDLSPYRFHNLSEYKVEKMDTLFYK